MTPQDRLALQRITQQGRRSDLYAAPRQRHVFALGDSITILGVKRSGKTTLDKEVIRTYRRLYQDIPLYILDPKRGGDFRGWRGAVFSNAAPPCITHGTQIWQPELLEREEANTWLRRIYVRRQPCVICITELSALAGEDKPTPSAQDFPRFYRIILKLGAALGLTMISETQEAAYIPRETTGQLTHFFRFRLQNTFDARKADTLLGRINAAHGGGDGGGEPPDKYGFYYARMDNPPVRAWYYPTMQHFFGYPTAA